MKHFIGIDVGTSGLKSVLFDERGQIERQASASYPLFTPHENWAEQNPEHWFMAAVSTLKDLVKNLSFDVADIASIGVSGQMHGLVMLDRNYRPLYNSIIWCDNRAVTEAEQLNREFGSEHWLRLTGNRALHNLTAAKLLWVKNNCPEIFASCEHIFLPKDYVRFCLAGGLGNEISDASGTQLLDVNTGQWSTEILNYFGLRKDVLGRVYQSSEIVGFLRRDLALAIGLAPETAVIGGGGDQAAAALGNGVYKPGSISCSLGTSGVIFAPTDRIQVDPQGRIQTFCHAVNQTWQLMGVTQGCGLSMKWLKDLLYSDETEPYKIMEREVSFLNCKSEKLLFLPYLMGERTPHQDPNARGVFFGLDSLTDRARLALAVMKGITFSLREAYETVLQFVSRPDELIVTGGGTNNAVWMQILTDVFGLPIKVSDSTESGALAMAILGAVGTGCYRSISEATALMIDEGRTFIPENSGLYEEQFMLYKKLYRDLKNCFDEASVDFK